MTDEAISPLRQRMIENITNPEARIRTAQPNALQSNAPYQAKRRPKPSDGGRVCKFRPTA
jgi:hypothetical protein